jgi:hypothetical protein
MHLDPMSARAMNTVSPSRVVLNRREPAVAGWFRPPSEQDGGRELTVTRLVDRKR